MPQPSDHAYAKKTRQSELTSRALVWPMKPAPSVAARPSAFRPRPLMCEWGAILDDLAATWAEGGGRALCAGAALVVEVLAFMTRVKQQMQTRSGW